MKFLKSNDVKVLSKNSQQQIKGGNPQRPSNCSHAAQGACMNSCMITGNYSSQTCYSYCFGHLNGC